MGTESDTAELLPEPSTWSGSGRWLVLLSFAFYSFSNAFIIMDFATDYDLSEQVLDTTEPNVAFLYTLLYPQVPCLHMSHLA